MLHSVGEEKVISLFYLSSLKEAENGSTCIVLLCMPTLGNKEISPGKKAYLLQEAIIKVASFSPFPISTFSPSLSDYIIS